MKPEAAAPAAVPDGQWLGCVVPKRHARRAVTRSLIKRQIRAVFADAAGLLPPGLWVVRLRLPVDRKQFPSAASDPLKALVREELLQLRAKLARAAQATPAGPASPAAARG
ncbi:ribonuclease P protein component [Roseateles flavus]|uniref:Ribonuclease P protein component n=1 Tax=Roseateles flavus TaxID=3149041 RepID=A0ABV0GK17_9BURK